MSDEACASESLFRSFFEAAPDAIVVVDPTGTIVLVNAQAEKLFHYTRADMIGRPVATLIEERSRARHSEALAGCFSEPRATSARLGADAVHRDGTEFPVEICLSAVEDEKGVLVCHVMRDITEAKHARAALERWKEAAEVASRELAAFSHSTAHELRTPLRGISGFSAALLEDCGEMLGESSRDHLNRIIAGADRMGRLIDGVLALSRVARAELRPETVDLSQLAHAVMRRLRASQPDRHADVVVEEELIVKGDARLLRALIEHLLGNAWRFTKTRPLARIELGRRRGEKGSSVYFVRDNGVGFDMAFVTKLFAPFRQLHDSGEFAGTGIGLAAAQRIVHRHAGRIWADGATNVGATFYFTLSDAEEGGPWNPAK